LFIKSKLSTVYIIIIIIITKINIVGNWKQNIEPFKF
jgi:hypothetical protein